MKKYIILLVIIGLLMCSGCRQVQVNICVVCGEEATHVINGPAEHMVAIGIDLDDCKQVTSSVYSVWLCDSCDKTPIWGDPM